MSAFASLLSATLWLLMFASVSAQSSAVVAVSDQRVVGDFEQIRSSPALDVPLSSKGVFYFSPELGMLWATKDNEISARFMGSGGSSLEFNGDEWRSPSKNSANIYRLIQLLIEQDEQQMTKKFRVQTKQKKGGIELELKPKQKRVARHINKVLIEKGVFLERVVIEQVDGSSLELKFSGQYSPTSFERKDCESHFQFNPMLCRPLFDD